MHAYSDYTIDLEGNAKSIRIATEILAEALDDEEILNETHIEVEETYEVVWLSDIAELAEKIVRKARGLKSMSIVGIVDTSESAGEIMDFEIKYEKRRLTVRNSCWYITFCADDFDSYEDFCEVHDGYSEEEYEAMCKEPRFILNSGDGPVVTKVPLDEEEVIYRRWF